jgi:hypothetical protein
MIIKSMDLYEFNEDYISKILRIIDNIINGDEHIERLYIEKFLSAGLFTALVEVYHNFTGTTFDDILPNIVDALCEYDGNITRQLLEMGVPVVFVPYV